MIILLLVGAAILAVIGFTVNHKKKVKADLCKGLRIDNADIRQVKYHKTSTKVIFKFPASIAPDKKTVDKWFEDLQSVQYRNYQGELKIIGEGARVRYQVRFIKLEALR